MILKFYEHDHLVKFHLKDNYLDPITLIVSAALIMLDDIILDAK